MSERTIVIGDAHGYPWIIENALDHAGFGRAGDRFIFSGDFVDRGPDPDRCRELIDQHADVVLVGNHDLGVLLHDDLPGYSLGSAFQEEYLREKVLNAPLGQRWRCAAAVGDVLVTHAGISARYERVFFDECGGDPGRLADWLNKVFDESVKASLEQDEVDLDGLLGNDGPLWFRFGWGPHLAGLRQVAGHTPVSDAGDSRELAKAGIYLVDANVYRQPPDDRYRYAVIESGDAADGRPPRVRVEDSELGRIE